MRKPLPSQETLQALLHYEPETGQLFWKPRPREMFSSDRIWKGWNTKYAEKPAFTSTTTAGYHQGDLLGKNRLAHRVIWKWVTGEEPGVIDHESGDQGDNRWCNLRSVDDQANRLNASRSKNNTSGVLGVAFEPRRQKFEAYIMLARRKKFLGYHPTLEAAAAARKAAEQRLGFHPNHGRG